MSFDCLLSTGMANNNQDEMAFYEAAQTIAQTLAGVFRETWEAIPFSLDLDRSEIFGAGEEFSVLVRGLVEAGFLEGDGSAVSGIYVEHYMAQRRSVGPVPRMIHVGGRDVVTIGNYYIIDGEPVYLEEALQEIVDHLIALVDLVTQFREDVEAQIEEMETFEEEPYCWLMWGRRRHARLLNAIRSRHYYCLEHVTHLRLLVETFEALDGGDPSVALEFCPAWGATAEMWEFMGWQVSHWLPLPSQAGRFEGRRSNHLGVYWWNVSGAENPALERRLLRIKAERDPAMFVITSTLAPQSHVYRIMSILGYEGHRENGHAEGTWLVWDTSRINVNFLRVNGDGWEMVITQNL